MSIPHKTCTKCGQSKSLADFHKRAASPDGLRPTCKACVKAYQQEWKTRPEVIAHRRQYERDRQSTPERRATSRRWRQGYNLRRKLDPALQARHNQSVLKYERKKYRTDPAYRHRKILRAASKRGASRENAFSLVEWQELCSRYGNKCLCCGQQKPLTADHVVPLTRGGSNTIDNIQPLCLSCNDRKHTKIIDYR